MKLSRDFAELGRGLEKCRVAALRQKGERLRGRRLDFGNEVCVSIGPIEGLKAGVPGVVQSTMSFPYVTIPGCHKRVARFACWVPGSQVRVICEETQQRTPTGVKLEASHPVCRHALKPVTDSP